jgi:Amt family ammonium transporter
VTPLYAIAIGGLSSLICYGAVRMKSRLGYDDSLDAFGVHGVGGIWGALATGVFAVTPVAGLLAGNASQLGKQALGVIVTVVFAALGTLLIGLALRATIGLRVSEQHERDGLDISAHGERGYHL